jgi:hypothetical protein
MNRGRRRPPGPFHDRIHGRNRRCHVLDPPNGCARASRMAPGADPAPLPSRRRGIATRRGRGCQAGDTVGVRRHHQAGDVPEADVGDRLALPARLLRIATGAVVREPHDDPRGRAHDDRRRARAGARLRRVEGQPVGAAPGAARARRPARAGAHGRHADEQRAWQRAAPRSRGARADRPRRGRAGSIVGGVRLGRARRRDQHHHS